MARIDLHKGRCSLTAGRKDMGAAGGEATGRRRFTRCGHRALDGGQATAIALPLPTGYGHQECLGLGMEGGAEKGGDRSAFNHLSSVHDHHPAGHLGDHAQIMADE